MMTVTVVLPRSVKKTTAISYHVNDYSYYQLTCYQLACFEVK